LFDRPHPLLLLICLIPQPLLPGEKGSIKMIINKSLSLLGEGVWEELNLCFVSVILYSVLISLKKNSNATCRDALEIAAAMVIPELLY